MAFASPYFLIPKSIHANRMKAAALGIFLAIASMYLSSCANQNPNEIALFNDYKFIKLKTEKVGLIDSVSQSDYEGFFNNIKGVQLPLYRVVDGADYVIYLGIPFRTGLKKLYDARQKEIEKDSVFLNDQQNNYCFYQYKKDSLFITEYLVRIDSNSIICIFGSTSSPQTFYTLFDRTSIINRISK